MILLAHSIKCGCKTNSCGTMAAFCLASALADAFGASAFVKGILIGAVLIVLLTLLSTGVVAMVATFGLIVKVTNLDSRPVSTTLTLLESPVGKGVPCNLDLDNICRLLMMIGN